VTSAHALDGTLAALLGHADEYLEKPVRVDTLIATATALIGQGRRPTTGRERGSLADGPGRITCRRGERNRRR